MNKALASIFVFVVLSSLMVINVKPVAAQATFIASVPEFSVKIIDQSYDVPPKYTTNPYTGESSYQQGYRVNNRSIEVTIKNQPFTPYTDERGSHKMQYEIQFKGHFSDDWQVFYGWSIVISNSEYTVVSRPLDNAYPTAYITQLMLPNDAILDFRCKVTVGYYVSMGGTFDRPDYEYIVDTESSWSDIQTISIKDGAVSYTPSNPTTSNTPFPQSSPQASTYYSSTQGIVTSVPYSRIIILLCVIVITIGIIVALAVVLLLRRHPKTTNTQPQQS